MPRLPRARRLLAALATCGVLAGCAASSPPVGAPAQGCIQHYDPNTDYFPNKVQVQDATHFTVDYHRNYKVVTVTEPWPGSTLRTTYVLVRCGTPPPAGYKPEQIVTVPLSRTVMLDDEYLSYYNDLGALGSIVGMNTSDAIGIPAVVNKIKSGQITSVGSSLQHQVDVEKLLALSPDAVFDVGTGNPTFDVYPKVQEAGAKVVLGAAYMEGAPLGKAEWIKFFGTFFDREAEATEVYDGIKQRYDKVKALVQKTKDRPTALLGYYSRTYWYVFDADGYMGAYLRDAGATNALQPLLQANRASNRLSFENVLANETGAQYWLNQNQFWKTAQDALAADSRYSQFTALTKGNAYNNNGQLTAANGNMFYQTGGTQPDVILQDLVKIFHPELLPDHKLVYYRKLE